MPDLRETDLYPPIKRFLEDQGYEVKSEIADCDVVAIRGNEDPIVVELKTTFNLPLVLQGVRRTTLSETVYLAFAATDAASSMWRRHQRDITKLCRMLGLGLLTIRVRKAREPVVEVHLDPAPYQPRKAKRQQAMLLREFQQRVGDPNRGGSSKRPIVTAYRQDALRCAALLGAKGPTKVSAVRAETGIEKAQQILQRDVYGWFRRTERAVYEITPNGKRALAIYADVVAQIAPSLR